MYNHLDAQKDLKELLNHPHFTKVSDDIYRFGTKQKHRKIISIIIHGNEIIGIPIIKELIQSQKELHFTLIVGNTDALKINKRFVNHDLNRMFLKTGELFSQEQTRAREISEFVRPGDQILDIHQTTAPSLSAFILTRNSEKNFNYVNSLNEDFKLPLILSNSSFSKDGKTFSEFALKKDIPFLTYEFGQAGFDQSMLELGVKVVANFLNRDMLVHSKKREIKVLKIINSIKKLNNHHHLISGIKNLTEIKAGQEHSFHNTKRFHCESDYIALFPKYGEYQKISSELCQLMTQQTWER